MQSLNDVIFKISPDGTAAIAETLWTDEPNQVSDEYETLKQMVTQLNVPVEDHLVYTTEEIWASGGHETIRHPYVGGIKIERRYFDQLREAGSLFISDQVPLNEVVFKNTTAPDGSITLSIAGSEELERYLKQMNVKYTIQEDTRNVNEWRKSDNGKILYITDPSSIVAIAMSGGKFRGTREVLLDYELRGASI